MILWALTGLAWAHLPHDTVRALGASDGPYWLLADPSGTRLLLRSDDQGRTFTFVGGEPIAELPNALTALDDGTVVVLGRHLWWGDGDVWTHGALPGDVSLLSGGDELLLAGRGGVWEGLPGALVHTLPDVRVVALGAGPSLVDEAGGVWWKDGGWTSVAGPVGVTAVVTDGQGLYAGDIAGDVWRYDDGWVRCGLLPLGTPPDIVALVLDHGVLLAATGWRAPFVSFDRCATWEDRGPPASVAYDTEGGATSVSDAYPILQAAGGRWLVGGWMGLWGSDDEGETWTEAPVVPADYTRGLAFAPNFDTLGRIWIGAYGAGPGWTADGGVTYAAPAHGLEDSNVQWIAPSTDPSVVYAIVGHSPWVSRNGGSIWEALGDGESAVTSIRPFGDDVWMVSEGADGALFGSSDGGATFAPVTGLDAVSQGAHPGDLSGFVDGDRDVRCVRLGEPDGVACTQDRGGAWAASFGDDAGARGPAATFWPPEHPTRILWADAGGVHGSDDALATAWTVEPTGDDTVLQLQVADDGTAFLVTTAGEVWRSGDGGETWDDLSLRVPAWAHVMAPRPDFADHPDLLVGTHDGLFHLGDATGDPTLARWARWQRADDHSGYALCADCPASHADPAAGLDSARAVPAGATLTATLRGTHLRVLGVPVDGGAADLSVDGVSYGALAERGLNVLAEVDLADGWHEVRVDGRSGDGVWLDALEMTGPGDVLTVADGTGAHGDHPESGCGCASTGAGGAAGWLSVGWACVGWLVRRRRISGRLRRV